MAISSMELRPLYVSKKPTYLQLPQEAATKDPVASPACTELSNQTEDCLAQKSLLQTAGKVHRDNNDYTPKKSPFYKVSSRGWRFGVALGTIATSLVFLTCLIFTIVVATTHPNDSGIGTLYENDCDAVDTGSTVLHAVINILSAIMLAASNYTMQYLTSPTRKEVDKAHSKYDWLDIGVNSLRNIAGRISRRRTAAWCALFLSSMPIHLMFNSAIFKTGSSSHYGVITATERFLRDETLAADMQDMNGTINGVTLENIQAFQSLANGSWLDGPRGISIQNLTTSQCIDKYGTYFVDGRGSLALIGSFRTKKYNNGTTIAINPSNTLAAFRDLGFIWYEYTIGYDQESVKTSDELDRNDPYHWMCSGGGHNTDTATCDLHSLRSNGTWFIRYRPAMPYVANDDFKLQYLVFAVDYCLSMKVPGRCKLQFSLQVLVAVLICNAIKASVMVWALFTQHESTLVTVGDAIASFLDDPDHSTKDLWFLDRTEVKVRSKSKHDHRLPTKRDDVPIRSRYFAWRWFIATNTSRWISTLAICFLCFSGATILLYWAAKSLVNFSGGSPFTRGFGALDAQAILTPTNLPQNRASSLITMILLINTPQVLCTFMYFNYNNLITSMLVAYEWSRYYLRPKPLRVSEPRRQQRSTYFLSLPYRYGLPLMAASTLLHWLISQSFFLAIFEPFEYALNGQDLHINEGSNTGAAYSCLPWLLLVLLGFLMLFTLFGLGFRKLHGKIPVAGSCSLAIAAACHRPEEDVDAAYKSVSWGQIAEGTDASCCFTSLETFEPAWAFAEQRSVRSLKQELEDCFW